MIEYVHRGQPLKISADDWNQMARAVNRLDALVAQGTAGESITDVVTIPRTGGYPYTFGFIRVQPSSTSYDKPMQGDRGRATFDMYQYNWISGLEYGQPAVTQADTTTAICHGLTLARFSSWTVGQYYAKWRDYDSDSHSIPAGTLQGTTERTPIKVLSSISQGEIDGQQLLWVFLDGREADAFQRYRAHNIVTPYYDDRLTFHAGEDGVSVTVSSSWQGLITRLLYLAIDTQVPARTQLKLMPFYWPSASLVTWPTNTTQMDVSLVVWYEFNADGTLTGSSGIGWQIGNSSPAPSGVTKRTWKVATAYKDGMWQWLMPDIPDVIITPEPINGMIKYYHDLP